MKGIRGWSDGAISLIIFNIRQLPWNITIMSLAPCLKHFSELTMKILSENRNIIADKREKMSIYEKKMGDAFCRHFHARG